MFKHSLIRKFQLEAMQRSEKESSVLNARAKFFFFAPLKLLLFYDVLDIIAALVALFFSL